MHVLQTLGMPEAARHASALLSLPPSHAACRSGDVGATLQQQQQRLTSAIRAGTATLHLDDHPGSGVQVDALSSDLSHWAASSLTRQTLTLTVSNRAGIVCQWELAGVCRVVSEPVFSYDNSRLGIAFMQASASGETCKVALCSLTLPDQQPSEVEIGPQYGVSYGPRCRMAAAPSADLFLVCNQNQSRGLQQTLTDTVALFFFDGNGFDIVQRQAPPDFWYAMPYNGPTKLFSPDSKYVSCVSSRVMRGAVCLHCLDIQTGLWQCLQRPWLRDPFWLQIPGRTPRLLANTGFEVLLIAAPDLAVTHSYRGGWNL